MFDGFERRLVSVGEGIEINCVAAGSGPPVLLLHGFPQNLSMWARVAPLLVSAGYKVVCADLRGYGDSSKPNCTEDKTNYTFRAMAVDQVQLMHELGHQEFHVIGHDRGGRTGHRMALDRGDVVRSLAVLDIVPTHAMFMETNHRVSGAYWHWYFLSQPAPFPERLISNDPDFFYETCLTGWGATCVEDFDADMLDDYRRCWRSPEMIHGSCADYAAAATRDLETDNADLDRKIECPTLALYGSAGTMANCFDIPEEWRKRCLHLHADSLPGGHFFVDQFPDETAQKLIAFLRASEPESTIPNARK